jgi:HTH-type transcriptional regulator / antitoxin HigA
MTRKVGKLTAVANTEINAQTYRRLLGRVMPRAISGEHEYERLLAEVDKLMSKGDALSPEEGALLDLIVVLIEDYEDEHHSMPASMPHTRIKTLIEERGLRQSDLVPVLGSRSRVSELLSGKRTPNKAQALAEFFGVSLDWFI